jgi:hypothetical protein
MVTAVVVVTVSWMLEKNVIALLVRVVPTTARAATKDSPLSMISMDVVLPAVTELSMQMKLAIMVSTLTVLAIALLASILGPLLVAVASCVEMDLEML